jgi:hypothetical protein
MWLARGEIDIADDLSFYISHTSWRDDLPEKPLGVRLEALFRDKSLKIDRNCSVTDIDRRSAVVFTNCDGWGGNSGGALFRKNVDEIVGIAILGDISIGYDDRTSILTLRSDWLYRRIRKFLK